MVKISFRAVFYSGLDNKMYRVGSPCQGMWRGGCEKARNVLAKKNMSEPLRCPGLQLVNGSACLETLTGCDFRAFGDDGDVLA